MLIQFFYRKKVNYCIQTAHEVQHLQYNLWFCCLIFPDVFIFENNKNIGTAKWTEIAFYCTYPLKRANERL